MKKSKENITSKKSIMKNQIDKPRKNWENQFKKMNQNSDDKLLINDIFEDENF